MPEGKYSNKEIKKKYRKKIKKSHLKKKKQGNFY